MHSHGRALNGLIPRAVDDLEQYHIREGEFLAGVAVGWNFGEGHFHHEQLLAAVQERCNFAEGDLRVVMLESQPAHVQRQRYRIWDAAGGLLEQGYVNVADMVERQPWLGGSEPYPVEVIGSARAGSPQRSRREHGDRRRRRASIGRPVNRGAGGCRLRSRQAGRRGPVEPVG